MSLIESCNTIKTNTKVFDTNLAYHFVSTDYLISDNQVVKVPAAPPPGSSLAPRQPHIHREEGSSYLEHMYSIHDNPPAPQSDPQERAADRLLLC